MTLPNAVDGRRMHAVLFGKMCGDVVDVPITMHVEHPQNDLFRLLRTAIPGFAFLRSGLSRQQPIRAGGPVLRDPLVDGKAALLHGTSSIRDRDLARKDTFNERGFHGCEWVSVVGFHVATVDRGCVRLIAAIRTNKVKYPIYLTRIPILGFSAYFLVIKNTLAPTSRKMSVRVIPSATDILLFMEGIPMEIADDREAEQHQRDEELKQEKGGRCHG